MLETNTTKVNDASPIPNKRYFTIGEAAKLCSLKPHVLRYWEQEFDQIKPVKRNNRRYYTRDDLLLLRQIQDLLHNQGFTISGARQWLTGDQAESDQSRYNQLLRQSISELQDILKEMKVER